MLSHRSAFKNIIRSKLWFFIGWQSNDVHITICGEILVSSIVSMVFWILLEEFTVPDSIIVLIIQNSFLINSANFCVQIPKSFIFDDQHQSHLFGKLYCDLHIWHIHANSQLGIL